MNWLTITLIAPFMWALVNHTDKYLINKIIKGRGIGALIIFSALIGLPVAFIIFLINPDVFEISTTSKLIMIINGLFYIGFVLPYLYALEIEEASIVVPLFQLSGVFTIILGYIFLSEALTPLQLIGSGLIIIGAIGLTSDLTVIHKPKVKTKVLVLMTIASFLVALNALIFKYIAIEESFLVTSFWEYIGFFVAALLLLLVGSYRKGFLQVIKTDTKSVLLLNSLNESINIVGKLSFNFASLLAPVALVSVITGGFQPVFVLIIGILISVFLPKISEESLKKEDLAKKVIFIAIIFFGTLLIN